MVFSVSISSEANAPAEDVSSESVASTGAFPLLPLFVDDVNTGSLIPISVRPDDDPNQNDGTASIVIAPVSGAEQGKSQNARKASSDAQVALYFFLQEDPSGKDPTIKVIQVHSHSYSHSAAFPNTSNNGLLIVTMNKEAIFEQAEKQGGKDIDTLYLIVKLSILSEDNVAAQAVGYSILPIVRTTMNRS